MPGASLKTRMLWGSMAVLGIAALLAVVALMAGSRWRYSAETLGTAFLTALYAMVMLVNALVLARFPRAGWVAAGLLAMSFVLWVATIWLKAELGWKASDDLSRVASIISVPGCVAVHLGVLFLPAARSALTRTLRTATVSGSIVSGLGLGLVFMEVSDDILRLSQAVGVALLLTLLGTVMVAVASALERSSARDGQESGVAQRTPVDVICPRCQSRASVRANTDGACDGCGLRIRVQIAEPRCECGYLLYRLEALVCPECGAAVSAESRWPGPTPISPD
ncbi:MAG: zinc ribbon domain-containing protein [Phycisphaeraceae bacterium]|nr:zinc ribbon domain-containing protein [Phycisphaeraceae bacterium]